MTPETDHKANVDLAKQRMRELFMMDLQTLYEAATTFGDELHNEGVAEEEKNGKSNTPLLTSIAFAYVFTFMIVRTLVDSGRVVLVKEHKEALEAAQRLSQALLNIKRSIH